MKKLLLMLLLIPVSAYSLEVSGVDGGGNADTLNGQNDSYDLDIGKSLSERHECDIEQHAGAIDGFSQNRAIDEHEVVT